MALSLNPIVTCGIRYSFIVENISWALLTVILHMLFGIKIYFRVYVNFQKKNDLKLHSIFISKYPLACLIFFSFCNLSNFCLGPHFFFFSTLPTLCVSACLLFLLLIQWFSNWVTCLSRETWKPDGLFQFVSGVGREED